MFKIIVRAQTLEEEIKLIEQILKYKAFYKKLNFTVILPKQSVFSSYWDTNSQDEKDIEKCLEVFENSIYDISNYRAGIDVVTRKLKKELLSEVGKYFETWKECWNFKMPKRYTIKITNYGIDGKYDPSDASIVMRVDPTGEFRYDPIETIVHEMIHLGFENLIVEKYNLTHEEKERIVDLICSTQFKKYFPKYELQELGDKRIDPYVTNETLNNLPKAIAEYVAKYPR